MIKRKTRSAAKKRFSVVSKGKIKRAKANRRHLLTKKSAKRKRQLRDASFVGASDFNRIKKLLPYG
ncbi:MAG: 50S ribosomal protein L35 [Candidatus Dependentiae bacterium]|nr:50S ribosomal protein L35 [Candidatus Dependentiae bacterium]